MSIDRPGYGDNELGRLLGHRLFELRRKVPKNLRYSFKQRLPRLLGNFFGQGLAQARPVDRVDRIEQRHRLLGLIRLQRSDQVQLDAGVALF